MKATVWLASIALVGVTACADNNRTADQTSRPATSSPATQGETTPGSPTAATEPSMAGLPAMSEADQALAQRVTDALPKGSGGSSAGQSVQVHAYNGEVTLRGSVSSEQDKTNIAAAAQQVTGVKSVNNQLEVVSASRS
jgi:osmotically-inducible protein OsmY